MEHIPLLSTIMKLKLIFLVGLLALLFSCNSSKNNSENKDGDYFFDFDELVHYRIEIDENVLLEKEDDQNISPEEQLQIDLIIMDEPNSIVDTSFIAELENIGFEKKQIEKDQFEKINEIFREKEVDEAIAYSCIAVYRDILIFKKNNKITGMAKICFSCDQNRIYGTSANTINFGQEGDYGKLNKILND